VETNAMNVVITLVSVATTLVQVTTNVTNVTITLVSVATTLV